MTRETSATNRRPMNECFETSPYSTVQQALELSAPSLHSSPIIRISTMRWLFMGKHAIGWARMAESDPTRDAPTVGCWPDQLSSDPFTAQPPPLQEWQQKRPSPVPQFAPKRWNSEAAGTEGDSPQIHSGRLAPDSSPVPGQQGQLLRSRLEYTYRHQRKHTCSEARITMQHDPASDFKICNWLINGLLLTTFKSD